MQIAGIAAFLVKIPVIKKPFKDRFAQDVFLLAEICSSNIVISQRDHTHVTFLLIQPPAFTECFQCVIKQFTVVVMPAQKVQCGDIFRREGISKQFTGFQKCVYCLRILIQDGI